MPKTLLKALRAGFAMLALCHTALAENTGITIPRYDDKYSKLVRQLETGETNINYREFRESFLESEQFKVGGNQKPDLAALRTTMHQLMKEKKYADVVETAKKILSIDYTDMEAHKILQQTYKMLGDAPNQKRHHDIEFGLLNSIVKNGDGKTCKTGWPVIQVTEEYFILEMLGAKVLSQSIDGSGPCDKMEVEMDHAKKVYYFEISKLFEGYNKRGIH